jgi:hypothetical protein
MRVEHSREDLFEENLTVTSRRVIDTGMYERVVEQEQPDAAKLDQIRTTLLPLVGDVDLLAPESRIVACRGFLILLIRF